MTDNLAKEAWLYVLWLKLKLAPPSAPQQHPRCKCFIPGEGDRDG